MPGDDPKKKLPDKPFSGQARFNAGPWDLPLKLKARNYSHEISSCHHPYWILMPTCATQSKIASKMESTQLNKTGRFIINAGLSCLSLNSPFNKINPPLEAVQAGDVPSLESRFRHALSSWCRMTMKDPASKRDKREISALLHVYPLHTHSGELHERHLLCNSSTSPGMWQGAQSTACPIWSLSSTQMNTSRTSEQHLPFLVLTNTTHAWPPSQVPHAVSSPSSSSWSDTQSDRALPEKLKRLEHNRSMFHLPPRQAPSSASVVHKSGDGTSSGCFCGMYFPTLGFGALLDMSRKQLRSNRISKSNCHWKIHENSTSTSQPLNRNFEIAAQLRWTRKLEDQEANHGDTEDHVGSWGSTSCESSTTCILHAGHEVHRRLLQTWVTGSSEMPLEDVHADSMTCWPHQKIQHICTQYILRTNYLKYCRYMHRRCSISCTSNT